MNDKNDKDKDLDEEIDLEENEAPEEENFEEEYVPADEDISFDDEVGVKDRFKKLRNDLKECQKEKNEYLTGWQRAQADYVNLKREHTESIKKIGERSKANFLEEFLPALDSFDMAFANKEAWEKVDANWRTGVEYIYSQLSGALERNGVVKVGEVNEQFNPNLHQSVESVPTDEKEKDHTIESVTQKGYKMGDHLIRPARVRVWVHKDKE